ncbi:Crp/Fnr family transcriptional regulator [Paracoccus benzoatiresistens]|uniref:Crp/Fnr family transcriptional regulator n=1 Tax=Paracoccus benzoatiresistens TaxID=2997341 RepID=A0ABT4J7W0_9RHOB|nr:Crp/Fnr family transcriptional regulator [Paracoccus sp. EF6]MCZ0963194.1 Crp/Fnr family transcriptional regulator [Paracoccus sp. EF6]
MKKPAWPTVRRLPRDTVLSGEDRMLSWAGVLKTGFLRVEHVTRDGHRNVLALYVPGDLVGNWTGRTDFHTVEAATDVEICSFDPRRIAGLLEQDTCTKIYVLQELANTHHRLLNLIWSRGALSSFQRIVAFLVAAMEIMPTTRRSDGSATVRMEISRRDWAALCGTTVETICRTLKDLSKADLVQQVEPGLYEIRNVRMLMRQAGMEHETIWSPRVRQDRARPYWDELHEENDTFGQSVGLKRTKG